MAIYRPTYRDAKTGELKTSKIWWYNFTFAGWRITIDAAMKAAK